MGRSRRRVLLLAEAVTLAHVGRMVRLAEILVAEGWEPILATGGAFDWAVGSFPCPRVPLRSVSPGAFAGALRQGNLPYTDAVVEAYARQEQELIREHRPRLVVGDFRPSLLASARIEGVPYVALANGYWSPQFALPFPVPEHPLVPMIGERLSALAFGLLRPAVFRRLAGPWIRLLRRHGLPRLPREDLQGVYTESDLTLFSDHEETIPLRGPLQANQRFIGPVIWSPSIPEPEWLSSVPMDGPRVLLSLGSSGSSDVFAQAVRGLVRSGITVIGSAAGAAGLEDLKGERAFIEPLLPMEKLVSKVDLVVCNGGALTTALALQHGKPLLGIPSNLDQYLNMACIAHAGAGNVLRSEKATAARIQEAVTRALREPALLERARQLQQAHAQASPAREFVASLSSVK